MAGSCWHKGLFVFVLGKKSHSSTLFIKIKLIKEKVSVNILDNKLHIFLVFHSYS